MLHHLDHWTRLRHMRPEQWELAWKLRCHPRWTWRSGMGLIYPDGAYTVFQGFLLPHGEPLPLLVNDRTAGCLMGMLADTGAGWSGALVEALERREDWREAVGLALLQRWGELSASSPPALR